MSGNPRKDLDVRFGDGHLRLSLPSARRLRDQLNKVIAEAEHNTADLQPPLVNAEGFLTRKSFDDFFKQVYSDKRLLDNHSGRLFCSLVRLVRHDGCRFDVRCELCTLNVSRTCGVTLRAHYYKDGNLVVSAESLKANLVDFMQSEWRNVGPKQKADLRLLVDNLP